MDEQNTPQIVDTSIKPIGANQIKELTEILQKYKSGKVNTEQRILSSENWWKLHNTTEEKRTPA